MNEVTRSPSAIDPDSIKELRLLNEDRTSDIVEELGTIFLKSTPGRIDSIQSAFNNKDFSTIRDISHTLKTSAAIIGAHQLFTYCQKIEELATTSHLFQIKKYIDLITSEYTQVETELRLIIDSY